MEPLAIELGLLQTVVGRQVLGFGFDKRYGYRLALGIYRHTQEVVHTALGALARFAVHNLNCAGGFFAADQVFGPTSGVQGGVDQFGSGVGFA